MQKVELLKKATNFGIREGLGAMPLMEIHPIRVAIGKKIGEGAMEKDEQGNPDEGTYTSTQLLLKQQQQHQINLHLLQQHKLLFSHHQLLQFL